MYFFIASWKVAMSGAVENQGCTGALLIALLKSALRYPEPTASPGMMKAGL